MKLAIISHTEHYKAPNGQIVGWGPTVNEINHLLEVFDEVYHVAMLYDKDVPPSALPYNSNRIHFVPIPSVGGPGFLDKLNTIVKAPRTLGLVSKVLKSVDYFQLRTPTGIGVYLVPYLTCFVKQKGWYKYAGNWNQQNPPLGYRIQRWLLKKQNRWVTINGYWEHQPKHHISFENPCLTEGDLVAGKALRTNKIVPKKVSFCFVGRLEREKGVECIIKSFLSLDADALLGIGTVHLVGSGDEASYFKDITNKSVVKFIFHGALSRSETFKVYQSSDVFLLPTTASEGFPKVIAEAMNFGCLPIVSDISAIGHYIKDGYNGYLLNPVSVESLGIKLKQILNISPEDYKEMLGRFDDLVHKFSFSHYNNRIKRDILNL